MFNFKKNNSDTSENVNKSYIKRRFNGIRSVALLGAVALSLGGCLSLQEYKEYKELKEQNERYEWRLPDDIDAELERIESDYQSQLEKYEIWNEMREFDKAITIDNFLSEYYEFCEETTFDYEGEHKEIIDGYLTILDGCKDVLENHNKPFFNAEKAESVLDLAQETFGELQGYLRYVESIKESKTTTQSEEVELELE